MSLKKKSLWLVARLLAKVFGNTIDELHTEVVESKITVFVDHREYPLETIKHIEDRWVQDGLIR